MFKRIIFVFLLAIAFAPIAKGSFPLDKWNYFKNISGVTDGIALILPDSEIYAKSSNNLADVRIVNGANEEVPYKLVSAQQESGRQDFPVTLLNNSIVPGKFTTAILNLGKRGIVANSLAISTSTENFQRSVAVYGSDDQSNWNTLKSDGYIYDFTDKRENVKSQKLSVRFPESVFQYYKIEIMEADDKPVVVTAASVSQSIQKQQASFEVNVTAKETIQDAAKKTTELILDMGHSGTPVNSLSLKANEVNYNRGVNIFSRNDKNAKDWRLVGQGWVFNYDTPKFTGNNGVLNFSETTDRYFKIVIYNNDNAALNIAEVKAFAAQQEIVFQSQSNQDYRIFYGNKEVNTPQYDLETYFKYLDLTQAKKVTISAEEQNIMYLPKLEPLSERIPYLFPLTLSTVGLILLLLVYKFLKKTV